MENKELLVIKEIPKIPENWDYKQSVDNVKTGLYKWKNITYELANELWIAREKLRSQGQRTDLTSGQKSQSWDTYCQEIGSERRVVNRWLQRWYNLPALLPEREQRPLPEGKYNIIYADPPWQYFEGGFKNQSQHYPTMTIDKLSELSVEDLAADDCILFLWATRPILPEAINLLQQWGFEYSTIGFVWVKSLKNGTGFAFGLGNWTRANAEYCLIGTKGSIERKDNNIPEIIYEPRREHSEKPAIVRDKIIQLVGELPRIELFARGIPTKGWDTWGNEVDTNTRKE